MPEVQTAPVTPRAGVKLIACVGLAVLPAVVLLAAIGLYAVDVPFLDEWSFIREFHEFENHTLSVWDIFRQHNEHRAAVPRLIYFFVNILAHGDVRAQMMATFGFACYLSALFFWLGRAVLKQSVTSALLLLAVTNLLIFSPVQYENWLWGFQTCMFIPFAAVGTGMAIVISRLRIELKVLLCILLCVCSSLSMAYGMATWGTVFLGLVVYCFDEFKGRRYLIAAWIGAAVLFFATYAWHYQKPQGHPEVLFCLYNPLTSIHFFLMLLGAPLTLNYLWLNTVFSTVVGGLICAFILAVTAYSLYFRQDRSRGTGRSSGIPLAGRRCFRA